MSSAISEALGKVLSQIGSVASKYARSTDSIRLVAVSKTKPVEDVLMAYKAGQRHFGENYVQELVQKAAQLPTDIQWHFIGHCQSNKVKDLLTVQNLYLFESVDSIKLANTLEKRIDREIFKQPLKVLVQVNTSEEASKSGIEPDKCVELVTHIVQNCHNLEFTGLMTIGKLGDKASKYFELLKTCKGSLLEDFKQKGIKLNVEEENFELSMGMSGDFELAIEHGATNVRVGSTIFGARTYPTQQNTNKDPKPSTTAA